MKNRNQKSQDQLDDAVDQALDDLSLDVIQVCSSTLRTSILSISLHLSIDTCAINTYSRKLFASINSVSYEK